MNGFVFPLQALLSFRRNRRDLCRQLLGQILADDARLAAHRGQLLAERDRQFEEIRRLSGEGRVSIDGAAMRRYHSGQLLAQAHAAQQNRQILAQQLELCRQAAIKADIEVKVLERLEEKHRLAFRADAERREQREREDAWTAGRLLENAR